MTKSKYLIVVGGPTASGKTSTAITLAQHFDAPILSCDSRQFYREMTIGTAKPTTEELAAAQHYFIDTLSIHEDYSVGKYEQDALACLKEIYEQKNIAILAGGTGLFIQAVCEGLDDFPDVSPAIRIELQHIFDTQGIEVLQEELKASDPAYFEEVDIHNARRIQRALGIIRATGKPFSSFRTQSKKERFFTPIYIQLDMDRMVLYNRINRRVDLMLEAGLLDEVRELYPHKTLNALQTVGYQEFFDHFDGQHSLEKAIELVKRNSRRYAKRQLTWFRRAAHWKGFHPKEVEGIVTYVENNLDS